jgi:hypothetical protein
MGQKTRERRTVKRQQAEKRQEARDDRSAQEQLALLDMRFGKGKGAVRERARLEHND